MMRSVRALGGRLARWLRGLSPRTLLVIGWVGHVIYAYPGFMSYDSVLQLGEARASEYLGGHPPMMGVLWGITDAVIAGPLGMLVIQTGCFLVGVFWLLRRALSPRAAALGATAALWFPPIAVVMAVIWKDAQMTGFLALGAALLVAPRRRGKLAGLALMFAATAMRYNALAITLPLVALLFAWSPAHRWWQRYPLALAAWLAVTGGASVVNTELTSPGERIAAWHDSLALYDLVGTLRHAPDLDDAELRAALDGTPLRITRDIQAATRRAYSTDDLPEHQVNTFGTGRDVPALWVTTFHVFDPPTTDDQRAAIARAWRAIVLGHPAAYLTYRWQVFRELIHLGDDDIPNAAYVWFTDVLDLSGSARTLGHTATSSRVQGHLRDAMLWLGASWLFRPWLYLVLAMVLVPLCRRDRTALALLLSGLANQAALFVLAPTVDYRYSIWLVVAAIVVAIQRLARRAWPADSVLLEGPGAPGPRS